MLKDVKIGYALTGSFCTFDITFPEIIKLVDEEANVYTVFSNFSQTTDTRFGNAHDFLVDAKAVTGNNPITTIVEAEVYGGKNIFDAVVIAPCTGNTLAKFALGITDSTVLMAAKGALRNNKPVIIAISTNDALGANMKNIGMLMNRKNVYFVPFSQDNYKSKPNSMVAHFDLIVPTIKEALQGKQIQPIVLAPQ